MGSKESMITELSTSTIFSIILSHYVAINTNKTLCYSLNHTQVCACAVYLLLTSRYSALCEFQFLCFQFFSIFSSISLRKRVEKKLSKLSPILIHMKDVAAQRGLRGCTYDNFCKN